MGVRIMTGSDRLGVNSSVGQVVKGVTQFMLGGNAEFTIFQEPNIQYKYNLKMNKDRTMAYVYMNKIYQGFIIKKDGEYVFYVGNKVNRNFNTKAINGLLWVLKRGDNLPKQVKVFHHGRCSVCGRKLTDSESIRMGMGPTCRAKFGF